jgi:hypothetical protein
MELNELSFGPERFISSFPLLYYITFYFTQKMVTKSCLPRKKYVSTNFVLDCNLNKIVPVPEWFSVVGIVVQRILTHFAINAIRLS